MRGTLPEAGWGFTPLVLAQSPSRVLDYAQSATIRKDKSMTGGDETGMGALRHSFVSYPTRRMTWQNISYWLIGQSKV
jgi:hypothetical protein